MKTEFFRLSGNDSVFFLMVPSLCKCTEWTEEKAVPALYREDVLVKEHGERNPHTERERALLMKYVALRFI